MKSESDLVLRYLHPAVEIVIPLSRAYLLGFKARGPLFSTPIHPKWVSSEKYDWAIRVILC